MQAVSKQVLQLLESLRATTIAVAGDKLLQTKAEPSGAESFLPVSVLLCFLFCAFSVIFDTPAGSVTTLLLACIVTWGCVFLDTRVDSAVHVASIAAVLVWTALFRRDAFKTVAATCLALPAALYFKFFPSEDFMNGLYQHCLMGTQCSCKYLAIPICIGVPVYILWSTTRGASYPKHHDDDDDGETAGSHHMMLRRRENVDYHTTHVVADPGTPARSRLSRSRSSDELAETVVASSKPEPLRLRTAPAAAAANVTPQKSKTKSPSKRQPRSDKKTPSKRQISASPAGRKLTPKRSRKLN